MEFEYDPAKSESNAQKHGIDFDQARTLWLDESVVLLASTYAEEDRYLAIGRIISVRRSRLEEKELYDQNR